MFVEFRFVTVPLVASSESLTIFVALILRDFSESFVIAVMFAARALILSTFNAPFNFSLFTFSESVTIVSEFLI